jgi:hypothetical protein
MGLAELDSLVSRLSFCRKEANAGGRSLLSTMTSRPSDPPEPESGDDAFESFPVPPERNLTQQEEKEIEEASGRWFPQPRLGGPTPLVDLLASPGKQGFLAGLAGAAGGGYLGGSLGSRLGDASWKDVLSGALLGGTLFGGAAGSIAYLRRAAHNQAILDALRAVPRRQSAVKADDRQDEVRNVLSSLGYLT